MGIDFGASEFAAASLIAGGIGTGVSVLGQMKQAEATAAEAKYQSQVAANNALQAEQYREAAGKAGEAQAEQVSLANAERASQARAAYGAGYIDPNTGSAKDVGASIREVGKLSTLNTIQAANLQQYGYQVQGSSFQAESALQGFKASQAPTAGLIGAGSSLLQGVSSLTGKYAYMQQQGIAPF